MNLVRRLQTTYRMEPAGSHGVWSLDDYQFMPFIWGSSQLVGKFITWLLTTRVNEKKICLFRKQFNNNNNFKWNISDNPRIEPKSFLLPEVVSTYKHEYLFIACIDFINQVKTGPFPEHSNQLWNISGVTSWSKINQGLIKMYKAEILCKFPVIQHVLFGSLMTFKTRPSGSIIRNARLSVTPPDPLKTLMDPPGVLKPRRDSENHSWKSHILLI